MAPAPMNTLVRKILLPVLMLTQLSSPGRALAGWLNRAPSVSLESVQKLFDGRKYEDVIKQLSESNIHKMRRKDIVVAYTLLGGSYQQREQTDKAIGVFQLAVELFPKDINVLSHLAGLLHTVELDDRARPLYERILAIHPNNAAAHLGLAEIERAQGNLEEALEHYGRCLEEWTQNAAVWLAYAQVLAEKQNFNAASAALQESIALQPGSVDSLSTLALFQYLQGLKSQAHETLRSAIAQAPDRGDFLLRHSLWLLEEGDLEASLSQAQRALRLSPQDPLGLWIRGVIALRRYNKATARRDLELAASKHREAPFIARIATAMILKMDWGASGEAPPLLDSREYR
ncbi:MAG: tetratricopeptide repeat protein [Elusimicrobia bacterium]|nr:tetratricopeptide repeat protein [Elusimicrobiota bacterium]